MTMTASASCVALIVAAGEGRRFAAAVPKQFCLLGGRPMLAWTLEAFGRCEAVDAAILVVAPERRGLVEELLARWDLRGKLAGICAGGARRDDSVQRGLEALPPDAALVAVHDGARPLVTPALIERVVRAAARTGAAIPALPVGDTIKRARADLVTETLDRQRLHLVQTPQVFEVGLLRRAYQDLRSARAEATITDDAQLVEALGQPVQLVEGEASNIKITAPGDLALAEALLAAAESSGPRVGLMKPSVAPPRIGHGYDVHRLVPGRPLLLGGVRLDHPLGLLGHSDADVLCHAAGDALLGAAALGDLGAHFSPEDPALRGVSSLELLRSIAALLAGAGYRLGNLDLTVVCQRPLLRPHVPAMRENLARALVVDLAQISVKATTTEGLGPAGRGEGIAAHAVALLVPV